MEFRADLVIELRDAKGATVLAIILEVQREKDATKKFSWVAYVGTARARKRCPTILLVVATDTDVAAWAMEPIDIGLGRGSLSPLVRALLRSLERLDGDHGMVYFQIVFNALRVPMQQAMEVMVMERQAEGNASLPPFVQKLIDRGALEGKREGKLEGKRDARLRFVTRSGIVFGHDDRARVEACTDLATLDRWLDNALGAKTAADVLA